MWFDKTKNKKKQTNKMVLDNKTKKDSLKHLTAAPLSNWT